MYRKKSLASGSSPLAATANPAPGSAPNSPLSHTVTSMISSSLTNLAAEGRKEDPIDYGSTAKSVIPVQDQLHPMEESPATSSRSSLTSLPPPVINSDHSSPPSHAVLVDKRLDFKEMGRIHSSGTGTGVSNPAAASSDKSVLSYLRATKATESFASLPEVRIIMYFFSMCSSLSYNNFLEPIY